MALDDLAARLTTAGAELTVAAARLPGHDPGGDAFGAAATGRLGVLGRDLHRAYLVALDARAREAGAHGARLSATADALAQAATGYAAADSAAQAATGYPAPDGAAQTATGYPAPGGAAQTATGYAAPADADHRRHRESP